MASELVNRSVSDRTRIIWGCSIEPDLEGTIKILLIVTGAQSKYMLDAQGRQGMNTRAAPRGAPQNAPAPQQYQQQGNDDDLDTVQ